MGLCGEFGTVITAGCDHLMQTALSSCVCSGCGATCQGRFAACPEVWAAGAKPAEPLVIARHRANVPNGRRATPSSADRPPARITRDRAASPAPVVAPGSLDAASPPGTGEAVRSRANDLASRPRTEAERRELLGRSFEHMAAELADPATETADRVNTHPRVTDHGHAVLSHVARGQDGHDRPLADKQAEPERDHVSKWVNESLPGMVAAAVQAAMEEQAAALSATRGKAERVRAEIQATGQSVQVSSGEMLEALSRRVEQLDDRVAAQLQAIENERSAMLEARKEQTAQSVVSGVPGLVDEAVRSAMERHAAERREGDKQSADRLRADSEGMRAALQRSFEKMLEALAIRQQEQDERAAASLRALEHEKGEVDRLWGEAARALTEALPAMVADAVGAAVDLQRAEIDAAPHDIERLRAEWTLTTGELREAVAAVRATLARHEEAIARQAAAYDRALPVAEAAAAGAAPGPAGRSAPGYATSIPALAHRANAEGTDGQAPPPARPMVPRERRVERRILKLDDSDEGPWPALARRHAALSHLLDGRPDDGPAAPTARTDR